MQYYVLTAFNQNGKTLLDEKFEAKDDQEAKYIGQLRLQEKQLDQQTHRCNSSSGKLLLFHR
ncbi:YhzD family protein [Litchfieldia alkalitelluris]|uniref:YhzD family protein n=1 Tax=Litchfieldia alkalitelluris TaxID=304268 RepID=UPI0009979FC2|nr:YhzD family protein [Litchfieldia alkalitelluris]